MMGACRNCGTPLEGPYCRHCGQSEKAGREQPISKLVGDFLGNAFAFDGKIPRTIAMLVWRPGRLSIEYREGRIVRYTSPMQLFWMAIILFVALAAIALRGDSSQVRIVLGEQNVDSSQRLVVEQFIETLLSYGPYIAVAFIPLFALLLRLFYRRTHIYYMYHLVFALHFHSLVLLLFALEEGWGLLFPGLSADGNIALAIFWLLPPAYLAIASHRFYAPLTRWSATWKSVLLMLIYGAIILSVLAASMILFFGE